MKTSLTRSITAVLGAVLLGLIACQQQRPPTALEQVKQRGELIVATRNVPTSYYEGPFGPTGFEYDLAKGFADQLGVKLRLVLPNDLPQLLSQVETAKVDFAAAGITITERRKRRYRFSSSYQQIRPQLVYNRNNKRPRKLDQLSDGILEVIADSSHAERLLSLRHQGHPSLQWQEQHEVNSEELLHQVNLGLIDYTVADSNEVAMARRFYTDFRVAFDIDKQQSLAWLFPPSDDNSLLDAANQYLARIKKNHDLAQLLDRYYGHIKGMGESTTRSFIRYANERLPALRPYFEKAALESGIDWRLLAAIAYQESHWDPNAVSPTGVRGVMMLTHSTAKLVGIKNRRDPEQSIIGGARYFKRVIAKIPERIPFPDRYWFAMAAYNVGYGHLEDARILAQQAGDDPDRWFIVEKYLPRLSQKRWYPKTKHGYARGREPVVYVRRIRRYFDLLTWYIKEREPKTPAPQWELPNIPLPGL